MNGRLLSVLVFSTLAFFACSQQPAPSAPPDTAKEEQEEAVPEEEGDLVAVIATEKGDIVVRLLPDTAPKSVTQFTKLADLGFYSRTTFHFISRGFILGGDPFLRDNDPYNDGLGNASEWVGVEFDKSHKIERGCVGLMRKESDPNTASCQFFIVLKRKLEWDGKYNIFGDVIEGIEVAETISKAPRSKNSKLPNQPAAKQIMKGIRIERRKLSPETAASRETLVSSVPKV